MTKQGADAREYTMSCKSCGWLTMTKQGTQTQGTSLIPKKKRLRQRSGTREAHCLPNLLAGGLPAGALPGLALAADKRAQHTHATQKSTAHARHTKRDVWVCTGEDMKEAIEMGGRPLRGRPPISIAAVISRVYLHNVWRACVVLFCVARVCEAMEAASARPGSAPPGKPPAKRLASRTAERCLRRLDFEFFDF